MLWVIKRQCGKFFHVMTSSCNWWLTPDTPGNLGQGFLTLISPPFTNMSSGHQRNRYVQRAWKSKAAHQGEVMDPWSYLYIYMACKSWFTLESDLQAKMWIGIVQVHDLRILLTAMTPGVYSRVTSHRLHVMSLKLVYNKRNLIDMYICTLCDTIFNARPTSLLFAMPLSNRHNVDIVNLYWIILRYSVVVIYLTTTIVSVLTPKRRMDHFVRIDKFCYIWALVSHFHELNWMDNMNWLSQFSVASLVSSLFFNC